MRLRLLPAVLPVAIGCAGIPLELDTSGVVRVDTSEIAGRAPMAPATGQPSYAEIVRLLGTEMAEHGNPTIWADDGRLVEERQRLRDDARPCVLVVVVERGVGQEAERRLRFVSLAEADPERIATCRVDGDVDCACVEGTGRLALDLDYVGQSPPPVQTHVRADRWRRDGRICFDSPESAGWAAEWLRYAARLCGAGRQSP